ncbi:MAG: Asp-tRNA(Asn)/Glu-tRNA(Gln) amidotransferase subunit GatA [Bernardetiaceae bacterium]
MKYRAYADLYQDLVQQKTTCLAVVEGYLERIAATQDLNIYLDVYAEEARARARAVDAKIAAGTAGKLAGLVIGLKDVIAYTDHGLQGSSRILDGFVSQFSSTATERLLAEDAIIIGRQNCDEFAMGSSNENSAFGPVRNPIDPTRVPGGSSGGSAAAVAADTCMVALGSDTGGSVRQPAAFCGIYGLKPSYARISRHGLVAYASSFDSIGILAHCPEDIALTLQVIAGADDFDSTVAFDPVPDYPALLAQPNDKKYRIAYINQTIDSPGLQPEIRQNFEAHLEALRAEGHQVTPVDFDLLDYILPTYYILTTAEASTNLSRYDGIRYGYRSPQSHDLETLYKRTRTEGFGQEVKRRIMLGTFVLSASYYDAYFTKAQKVRRLIQEKTLSIFQDHDFILCPTTPTTAFEIGKYEGETVELYLADLYTVQASICGTPAISVPSGKDSQGLPIGLQVMGNAFTEVDILQFAHTLRSLRI